ncbi:YcaO-like family protein [Bowmanella dokdonensis]|uniref:YcaO-like family protein n=1 Tax=Bowmanella dokdonensis TaxID=751969 RepID=A0A939DKF4_9ALTE|nr:YcaO-like family protein [Bowmanella dokdonensis]MBN7823947.1 YcaO-like family protein [Bowmanella dokdonensis]
MKLFDREIHLDKQFIHGTHRACSPEQTVQKYWPMASRMGITRLANVTGLDYIGMPVWVAVRPNSAGLSTSQGKGLTDHAAKASALMESIECWHAENIELPCRLGSYSSLKSELNLADISRLNYYRHAPPRDDLAMPWLEGYDLMNQTSCWVPFETVSTNYVMGAGMQLNNCFVQSSNGLAGGNHMLESITHALCELIERDALAQRETDMRTLPAEHIVRPETVNSEICKQALRLLTRSNLDLVLVDLTSDVGIPVFGCSILDADPDQGWRTLPVFNGYGCHLAPEIALFRAISEAVQSRLTHISGSRDDIVQSEYQRGGNKDDLLSFQNRLRQAQGQRDFRTLTSQATDSFDGDVDWLLQRLRAVGIDQAIVVDLTRRDFAIPVVKVVVPGLAAPVGMMKARAVKTPARKIAYLSTEGRVA